MIYRGATIVATSIMPVNEANNERERINTSGTENVASRNEFTANSNILTNSITSQTSANPSFSLDEEVIRRRGKRERKCNIVAWSMDPSVLATRKSPVKRPRSNSATLYIKIADLQKSPANTPVKRTSTPSSPGVMTRNRLNMSCVSEIGSASSSSSPSSLSTSGTRSSKSISVINARRSRRNLRRLANAYENID